MAVRIIEPQSVGEIKTIETRLDDMSSYDKERLFSAIAPDKIHDLKVDDKGNKTMNKYGQDSSGFSYKIEIKSTF